MANTDGGTATLENFTIFSRLATELQFTIWEFAVDNLDGRIIQLVAKQDGEISSTTLAPTLLHVCSGSRKMALKKYDALTLGGNFNGTHIRWEKDTVIFQGDLKAVPTVDYKILQGNKFDQLFDNCISLAMSFRNAGDAGDLLWSSPSLPGPNDLDQTELFLRRFKKLHTLWAHDNFKVVAADTRGDGNLSFVPLPHREVWNSVVLQRIVDSANLSIKETHYGYFIRDDQKRLRRNGKTSKLVKRGVAKASQTVTKGANNGTNAKVIGSEITGLGNVGEGGQSLQLMKHRITEAVQTVTDGVGNGQHAEAVGGATGVLDDAGEEGNGVQL